MQRTMLAAAQATDEQLIATRYLMRIFAHLAFSSSAQKDDSDWGPSPDCMAGVVMCSLRDDSWDDFNGDVAIFNVYK